MNKLERRTIVIDSAEMRSIDGESRIIEGYALVFNKLSRNFGGWVEKIEPRALDGVIEISDIIAVFNHKHDSIPYARCTKGLGTLELSIDEVGLKYRFEAPNAPYGEDILEAIKRGDINTSSFAFIIADGGERWEELNDGTYVRTITQFERLVDVSPVTFEAYEDTTVAVRSLEEFKEKPTETPEKEEAEAEDIVDEPTVKDSVDYQDEIRFLNLDILQLSK